MTRCEPRHRGCLYCVDGGMDCGSEEPCRHHGVGEVCRFRLNMAVVRMDVREGAAKRHRAFLPVLIEALIDAGNDLNNIERTGTTT